MAITLENIRKLNAVSIISRIDDAVDHEATNWEEYDKDPIANANKIVYLPQKAPTVFLCNFELSAEEAAMEKDAMMGDTGHKKQVKTAIGRWAYTVAKLVLKDIKNPAGVKSPIVLKKDGEGYVSENTMNLLERCGIVQEIFQHYLTLARSETRQNSKN